MLKQELKDYIYIGMTAAQMLVEGSKITETVIATEPYSWSGVYSFCEKKGISVGVVGPIIKGLPNGEGDAINDMLLSGKFDFSNATNRAKIQALADANISVNHTAVANALLDIALVKQTRWEAIGIPTPTEDEIKIALIISLASETMTAVLAPVAAKNTALQGWLQALDTSVMSSVEVQAYVDDLFSTVDGNPTGGV